MTEPSPQSIKKAKVTVVWINLFYVASGWASVVTLHKRIHSSILLDLIFISCFMKHLKSPVMWTGCQYTLVGLDRSLEITSINIREHGVQVLTEINCGCSTEPLNRQQSADAQVNHSRRQSSNDACRTKSYVSILSNQNERVHCQNIFLQGFHTQCQMG